MLRWHRQTQMILTSTFKYAAKFTIRLKIPYLLCGPQLLNFSALGTLGGSGGDVGLSLSPPLYGGVPLPPYLHFTPLLIIILIYSNGGSAPYSFNSFYCAPCKLNLATFRHRLVRVVGFILVVIVVVTVVTVCHLEACP